MEVRHEPHKSHHHLSTRTKWPAVGKVDSSSRQPSGSWQVLILSKAASYQSRSFCRGYVASSPHGAMYGSQVARIRHRDLSGGCALPSTCLFSIFFFFLAERNEHALYLPFRCLHLSCKRCPFLAVVRVNSAPQFGQVAFAAWPDFSR